MSTRDYLIKTAKDTENAIWSGLPIYLYRAFLGTETDQFASDLSLACVDFLKNSYFSKPETEAFAEQWDTRIRFELNGFGKSGAVDNILREILSKAVYNIGYGVYVASGGGLFVNRYLRFIRVDAETDWHSAPSIRRLTEAIKALPDNAGGLIAHLREFSLWIPRKSDPNEQEYYKAVQLFQAEQDQWMKQHSASYPK